jgi:hypothetical protein
MLCPPFFCRITAAGDGEVVHITSQVLAPICQSHQSYMPFASKSFRHEIRKHVVRGAIFDAGRAFFDVVSDEVELNIDVLRFSVMRGVFASEMAP